MKIIGVTGAIGCGKTFLSKIIKELNFVVYSIDNWGRNLYNNKKFLKIIEKEFPIAFDNNIFNKRKLRNYVFENPYELKKLESIIHPLLKDKLKKIINKNAKRNCPIFLDLALLYEMKWDKYCDYVIVVDVDNEIQKQRVMNRDKISEQDFYNIIKAQMSKNIKKERADIVINTDNTKEYLKSELIKIFMEIL